MKLPIDVLSRRPLQFRWQQAINTLEGRRLVENTGPLSPSAEEAVVELIDLAKQLYQDGEQAAQIAKDNVKLRKQLDDLTAEIQRFQRLNEGLSERVAKQSDLLSKRAEKLDHDEGQPERAKRKR